MKELLGSYTKAFVVGVDNVGSGQLQNTRKVSFLFVCCFLLSAAFSSVAFVEHSMLSFLSLCATTMMMFVCLNTNSALYFFSLLLLLNFLLRTRVSIAHQSPLLLPPGPSRYRRDPHGKEHYDEEDHP